MKLRPARTLESSYVDDRFPPQNSSSEVDPTIRESDGALHLAFRESDLSGCAVVTFVQPYVWKYGFANDEALAKRNLWGLSLSFYEFHIVHPAPSDDLTEWLATFHDGCFRIVARDIAILSRSIDCESPSEALNKSFGIGDNQVL